VVGVPRHKASHRTRRFTEWRPRDTVWQFESNGGAAIGELIVRPYEDEWPSEMLSGMWSPFCSVGYVADQPVELPSMPELRSPTQSASGRTVFPHRALLSCCHFVSGAAGLDRRPPCPCNGNGCGRRVLGVAGGCFERAAGGGWKMEGIAWL
jgi:hypothetical protein